MKQVDLSRYWFVQDKDVMITPSNLYHENSKTSNFRVFFGDPDPKKSNDMKKLIMTLGGKTKCYEYLPRIYLKPRPWEELNVSIGKLLANRRTVRNLINIPISFETISSILSRGCGINGKLENDVGGLPLRTYPSGGALFPLETYIAILNSKEIALGLYHYYPYEDYLSQIKEGDFRKLLKEVHIDDKMMNDASLVIFITAVFMRSRFKYGERSYRFILLEAGHLAQNLILMGQALNLSVVPMGGFLDRMAESFLEVDGVEESVIYTLIVGNKNE
jgi:SagB-type dehydrogenase family enzyme